VQSSIKATRYVSERPWLQFLARPLLHQYRKWASKEISMDLYLHLDLQGLDSSAVTNDTRAHDVATPPACADGHELLEDLDLRLEATRGGAPLPEQC
jgi:hypothetical protein